MNLKAIIHWSKEISIHLPSLNKWQQSNLAVFSQGVVKAESCVQSKIARALRGIGRRPSMERRLQRFLSNRHLKLETVQEEWATWVLKSMPCKELILLVDETHLGEHLSVMVVGLAYESRCIPLVWRCYTPDAYPAEGQVKLIAELLARVAGALPAACRPLIQADRGLGTSPDLMREVQKLKWRYLFRVQGQSKLIKADGTEHRLDETVQPGSVWYATGKVFKKRGRIPAHARVIWAEDQSEPWALITNDPDLTGCEYAQRVWQEQSFRDLKSGGWQWQRSQVWTPAHADRLLLILSLAYAWVLALGYHLIQAGLATPLRRTRQGSMRRRLSIFREGLHYLDQFSFFDPWPALRLHFFPDPRFS